MSQPEQAAPSYAFFDFDGTITQGDSFIPFLRYHLGTGPFLWHLLRLAPVFIGYGLKLIPNDRRNTSPEGSASVCSRCWERSASLGVKPKRFGNQRRA